MTQGSPQFNVQSRDAFALERRQQIWRLVSERGRVRTAELAQLFQVTEPTIRKDIVDLEAQNLLIRTHGGAIARKSTAEVGLLERDQMQTAEKRAAARACVDLIHDGESIFLDCGVTSIEIARQLATRSQLGPTETLRHVKIVTNSFRVAELCADGAGEPAVLLGGQYRASNACFVGPLTLATLRQFRVDLAFLEVTGITEAGFTISDLAEAQIKSEVMDRAARIIVPIAHHKVGLIDFVSVCPLSRVHTVVVDRLEGELAEWLASASVELILSGEAGKD